MTRIFDATPCQLGEGPLWHPARGQLFWFDIKRRQLLTRAEGETRIWQFNETVSAAGWVDNSTLLIASQKELFTFDLETGQRQRVAHIEGNNAVTRSNDGRADPWGGFWIGTMGVNAEPGAGAIYRYYRGEVRRIISGVTISNAICFDPDGTFVCFCDTAEKIIRKLRLDDADGWPVGEADAFIDMRNENLAPDGAVIDADGTLWNAQWGSGRVAAYDRTGTFQTAIPIGAKQTTCPAFGGEGLSTLFVTSATTDLSKDELKARPENGMTFESRGVAKGQKEHKVIL